MIEEGTVTSDLILHRHTIPRMMEVVESVEPGLSLMLKRKYSIPQTEEWYGTPGGAAMFDEVSGILSDAVAPYSLYFGLRVGHGADLGFWPIEDDCAYWKQEMATGADYDPRVERPSNPHTACGNCVMCIESAAHLDNEPDVEARS